MPKKSKKEVQLKTMQLALPSFIPGIDFLDALEEEDGNIDFALGTEIDRYLDIIGRLNGLRLHLNFVEDIDLVTFSTNGPFIFIQGPLDFINHLEELNLVMEVTDDNLEPKEGSSLFSAKDIFKTGKDSPEVKPPVENN